MNRRFGLGLISLLFLLGGVPGCAVAKEQPVAVGGVLDLREWQADRDGTVQLDGEWEFFWNRLLTPADFAGTGEGAAPAATGFHSIPGAWNKTEIDGKKLPGHGHATFRLKLLLKGNGESLALNLPDQFSSYRVWIAGKDSYQAGVVGTTAEDTVSRVARRIGTFKADRDEITVILQVANFEHQTGGPRNSIELGLESVLRKKNEIKLGLEMLIFGALVIMGLYHFGLYSLRHKDRSPLWFGLFCVLLAARQIFRGEIFIEKLNPDMPYRAHIVLEYLTFYLTVPFMTLFFHSVFPRELPRKLLNAFLILSAVFLAILLTTPPAIFTKSLIFYLMLMVAACLTYLVTLSFAVARGREGALLMIGGGLVFLVTIANDNLYAWKVIHTTDLAPAGLLFFIFAQSFILSMRFSRAFTAIELLSQDLSKTNVAYRRFVPREFLKYLNKQSIIDVELGDQVQREMTVLFSDIRSFTELSEHMTPKENFDFINTYLKTMSPIINRNNGFIDKYIGDAIMALFPERPEDAVQAAVQLQHELNNINQKRRDAGEQLIECGIGIHTGLLMLGTIGGEERMEGTVISDAVNVASRLEGLTKVYGCKIIVSQHTLDRLQSGTPYEGRFLDRVKVKGKQEALSVVEILDGEIGESHAKKLKTKKQFDSGVSDYFNQKFADAAAHFQKVLNVNSQDKAARMFFNRSKQFEESGAPADWEGVQKFDTK